MGKGDIVHTVKVKSNDLAGFKLHQLTGPQYWSYEGVEPHFWVIEFEDYFYAFWDDRDLTDFQDALLETTGESIDGLARFTGKTLKDLMRTINKELRDNYNQHIG